MSKKLLASIHDVTPYHEARIDPIAAMLDEEVGPGKYALLVVPEFHGLAKLQSGSLFATRIRNWAEQGCDIFLHGYYHQDKSTGIDADENWKARHLTAGEGEFLSISESEANRLIGDGRKMVEDIIGRKVDGFIAPAWLYGEGALSALAGHDFPMIENHFKVWDPKSEAQYARGPVISYATRTKMRLASSLLFSRVATLALGGMENVRIALHPHDVDSDAIFSEARRAIRSFRRSHVPESYKSLLNGSLLNNAA